MSISTGPVIELLTFTASDLYMNHISVVDDALQQMANAEGSGQAYRGREVEDNETGYVLQVWDSLEHHRRFAASPDFMAMRREFEKCVSHDKSRMAAVVHVPYDPQSTAISQPAVVILRGRLKDYHMKPALDAKIAEIRRELEGLAFGGPTLEDPDVYCVILGARTIERFDPNGTGERLTRALGDYMEVERRHAWMKPFAGVDCTRD